MRQRVGKRKGVRFMPAALCVVIAAAFVGGLICILQKPKK